MKGKTRNAALVAIGLLASSVFVSQSVLADQWSTGFTRTSVHAEDDSGSILIYIQASTVINPAGCGLTDGYAVTDSLLMNEALATALAGLASGQQIGVYVSSSTCASDGRPLAKIVELL